jgi:hypothetical protein
MAGKAFATLASTGLRGMAKNPMVWGTGIAAGGGAIAGGVGGAVWDYESRAGQGAMLGAGLAVGAGVLFSGGRGAFRMAGLRKLAHRGDEKAIKQFGLMTGRLATGAIAGGAIGAFAGPTDSTMANIAMGATAGAGGAVLGARLGARIGSRFTQRGNLYGGIAHGGAVGTAQLYAGRMGGRSMQISTATIGASATALFAPAAAHAMIGGSRREKRMNSFNRY